MRRLVSLMVCIGVVVGVGVAVTAGVRKIEVLPIDGNADPALRAKLDATLQKLAHSLDGKVEVGAASFADAAIAVGCDASTPACANTVLSTLGADEIVWGTATTDASTGQTTLVVKRATKGVPPNEQTTTLAAQDPPEKAEDGIKPLFGPVGTIGSSSGSASGSALALGSSTGSAAPSEPWSQDKKIGYGCAGGGAVALVIGFAFWASASSINGQIDSHPTNTYADILATKALEDKASSDALWGNVLVIAGLAAGGVGAYYIWKDHKDHQTTVAPVPAAEGTGMSIVVGGRW